MAERKATNKYYPLDWTPQHGSVNAYHGQHPLRERARKIKQGILVIRFEMPFSVWCLHCRSHIGMGTRFNAEKKTVGKYFSTNILSFTMKCTTCKQTLEIQTDPKARDYACVRGCERKASASGGLVEVEQRMPDRHSQPVEDAFSKLEKEQAQLKRVASEHERVRKIQAMQESRHKDDWERSRELRRRMRESKKRTRQLDEEWAEAQKDYRTLPSLQFELLPGTQVEALTAQEVFAELHKRKKRKKSSSVGDGGGGGGSSSSSSSGVVAAASGGGVSLGGALAKQQTRATRKRAAMLKRLVHKGMRVDAPSVGKQLEEERIRVSAPVEVTTAKAGGKETKKKKKQSRQKQRQETDKTQQQQQQAPPTGPQTALDALGGYGSD